MFNVRVNDVQVFFSLCILVHLMFILFHIFYIWEALLTCIPGYLLRMIIILFSHIGGCNSPLVFEVS